MLSIYTVNCFNSVSGDLGPGLKAIWKKKKRMSGDSNDEDERMNVGGKIGKRGEITLWYEKKTRGVDGEKGESWVKRNGNTKTIKKFWVIAVYCLVLAISHLFLLTSCIYH